VNAPLPMLDLSAGIAEHRLEIERALARVIAAGAFIQGPDVAAFEAEMASYLEVSHCVALHSGTDALVLGLRALGVGPGDEVIVPAFSFCATAEAVSVVGATPVFVDIDPRTFNLDPAGVEAALSRHTRALLPVHLFGQGAAMDALLELAERHELCVLEDAAQALGGSYGPRRLGSLGHAAALSFFPSKNLGAFGDGGMLATNQAELAELCRELREHGRKSGAPGRGREHERIGCNSRLDTLQAAVLRVKLPWLEGAVAARRAAAERYDGLLSGLPGATLPWRDPRALHSFHQYTLQLPAARRDQVQARLLAQGIQTRVYYPTPLHRLPAYAGGHRRRDLAQADAASRRVLSLPLWPEIPASAQARVADALRQALA